MANTILIKRSSTPNAAPTANALSAGELAINTADGKLFFKDASGNVQVLASIGGQSFAGNITAGNIFSLGIISASSTVTAGNITTGGTLSATGAATLGNTLTVTGTANVGSLETLGNITTTANISGNYILGNGHFLTGIDISPEKISNGNSSIDISTVNGNALVTIGGNLVATFYNNGLNVAGPVSASGNVTAGNITANSAGEVRVGNIRMTTNSIAATSGNIAIQPAMGSSVLLQLSGGQLSASGNIVGSNLSAGAFGSVTGASVSASGNISGGNITTAGTLNANGAATLGNTLTVTDTVTGGNITTAGTLNANGAATLGNTLSVTSTVTGGNLATAGTANVGGTVTAGNVTTGGTLSVTGAATLGNTLTVTDTVTGGNITTAGTLNANSAATLGSTLSVTGAVTGAANITGGNLLTGGLISATSTITSAANVSGANLVTAGTVFGKDALFTGNLTVDGNVTYINITDLNVEDPIIGLGRGANNQPLTSNDGKDRGEQLWYYSDSEKSAFIGYQNLSGKIIAASNVTLANDVVTVNSYGTFVVGALEGTTASLTGTVTAGNVTTAGTGNIATLEVGTLANIKATTASTSTSTGALIVAGGVGVAGNVYAADMFKNGVTVLNANDTVDGGTY